MKIRHGFVSNSSSSSFIINKDDRYPNSFSLARAMLNIRNNEDDDSSWGSIELRKLEVATQKNLSRDISITFPTCNYDTYITSREKDLLVSTCNNTDWSSLADFAGHGRGHDEGDYIDIESKTKYWFLREGVVGRPIHSDEADELIKKGMLKSEYCTNKNHFSVHIMLEDGTVICPECWSKLNPKKDMYLDIKIIKPDYVPFRGIKLR